MLNDPAIYHLAPGLNLRLSSPGHFMLEVDSHTLAVQDDILSVLEAFKEPCTMQQASLHFEKMATSGRHFASFLELARHLCRDGFLRKADSPAPLSARTGGFGSSAEHSRMLHDVWRTDFMVRGIEAVVRPGDVVVEIGAGSGILSMAAARAGASRVYAFEQGAMAECAAATARDNGFADTIQIIRSWSWDAELPERADVIIGEILGNDPFVEGLLPAYQDAARRLAKPDARFLPGEIRLRITPMHVPDSVSDGWSFGSHSLQEWHEHYGFDFSGLADFLPEQGEYRQASPGSLVQLDTVGPHLEIARIHPQLPHPTLQSTVTLEIFPGRTMNALLLTWEAHLADGIVMATHPPLPAGCSWKSVVWLLPQPRHISGPARARVDWTFTDRSRFVVTPA